MISGLFYYMVTIFNIIFPFHILLERFSHRTFYPSFYREYCGIRRYCSGLSLFRHQHPLHLQHFLFTRYGSFISFSFLQKIDPFRYSCFLFFASV